MTLLHQRFFGWTLVGVGLLVAVFHRGIVSPGLERVLGIETLVGRGNVEHLPDGGDVFTNPGAMVRWNVMVAGVGLAIAVSGLTVLIRSRGKHGGS